MSRIVCPPRPPPPSAPTTFVPSVSLHRGATQVDVTGDWPKATSRRLWQPNGATRICMLHARAIWRQCSMIKQSRDANYSPAFGAQLAATEPTGLFAKRKRSCVFKRDGELSPFTTAGTETCRKLTWNEMKRNRSRAGTVRAAGK